MNVRAPQDADAAAVAALLNEIARGQFGDDDVDEAEVRRWWTMPEVEALVVEDGGGLVAYGDMARTEETGRAYLDLRVRAGAGEAAGDLIDRFEGRARQLGLTSARVVAPDFESEILGPAGERGYAPIRHSFRMLIELDGPQERPAWPDGIAVRTMGEGEERSVHAAVEDAFADHWDFHPEPFERFSRFMLEDTRFDPSLFWLALEGEEIAGVCLCRFHESGDPGYGWVSTLGVRPPWRRRGLGEALLRHAFAEFAGRGARRVGLGVDAENTTGAVRLYERAGMRVARRYDTLAKEL